MPSFFISCKIARKPEVGTTDKIKSASCNAIAKSDSTLKRSLNLKSPKYNGLERTLRMPSTCEVLRAHKQTSCLWLICIARAVPHAPAPNTAIFINNPLVAYPEIKKRDYR